MPDIPPIPNSYWVEPGRLLAGEYPRPSANITARQKLRRLLEAGVTFIINLTEAGESPLKPYEQVLQEEAAAAGRSVQTHRAPIRDFGTPAPEEMAHILDQIDAALAAGHTVYVHCHGGIGRTGTVVGCHLVRRGLEGPDALRELARLRQAASTSDRPSPETEAQRQMILTWPADR